MSLAVKAPPPEVDAHRRPGGSMTEQIICAGLQSLLSVVACMPETAPIQLQHSDFDALVAQDVAECASVGQLIRLLRDWEHASLEEPESPLFAMRTGCLGVRVESMLLCVLFCLSLRWHAQACTLPVLPARPTRAQMRPAYSLHEAALALIKLLVQFLPEQRAKLAASQQWIGSVIRIGQMLSAKLCSDHATGLEHRTLGMVHTILMLLAK